MIYDNKTGNTYWIGKEGKIFAAPYDKYGADYAQGEIVRDWEPEDIKKFINDPEAFQNFIEILEELKVVTYGKNDK